MRRKPVNTRLAFITTASFSVAALAGNLAEAIAEQFQFDPNVAGHTTTAVIAIWIFDKLNTLIDDKD